MVERFTDICQYTDEGHPEASMMPIPDGAYVRYSDYASLEAELKAAREALTQEQAALDREIDDAARLAVALRSIAEGNLGDDPWQANYARIREVARAALSQPPVGERGWQEMGTAPKDGTRILVWDRYVDGMADAVVASWVADSDYGGDFEWHHWSGGGVLYDPQCWMPLPAAPGREG